MLAVAGTVYGLVGLSYIFSTPNESREIALRVAIWWMPLPIWGAVWIVVGALAILSSRWPPASETWGYTTMTGLAAAWAGFYATGMLFGSPAQNTSGVLVWGLVAFMWWSISGLVNPGQTVLADKPIR